MTKSLQFNPKELVYPIVVLLFSVCNFFSNLNNLLSLSILNSVIGIVGVVLLFYRIPVATKLIYFWTISQIFIIKPYIDFSQVITFSFFFGDENRGIFLNYLPIFFLGFIKIMEAMTLIGKRIVFSEFRETVLGNVFPMTGVIESVVNFGHDKNYLLVKLDTDFNHENENIGYVLTKAKDKDKIIKPGKKNQLGFFRIVPDKNEIGNSGVEKFPFIDWVRVQ
jgi:hypothetical protein